MQLARPNRLRRALAYAVLASLLGLVTLVLSQCTMVGDNVTGVGIERSVRASCIQNCKDARDICAATAAHDCDGTDNACYEAAFSLCQEQFKACKDGCHKQGAGSAS